MNLAQGGLTTLQIARTSKAFSATIFLTESVPHAVKS